MNQNGICPIWGVDCVLSEVGDNAYVWRVQNSYRTGGDYEITTEARLALQELDDDVKVRLTSILVEQWMKGVDVPRLTEADVLRAQENRRLPVHERADRLLRLLATRSSSIGEVLEIVPYDMFLSFAEQLSASGVPIGTNIDVSPELYLCPVALAWSESAGDEELGFLNHYLATQGWISKGSPTITSDGRAGGYICRVEVPGYSRIEELETNPDLSQCFVAMWFDDSLDDAYENGIKSAIEEAGYSPLRIDREEFLGKIDDAIIAEIRRSRFVVADFTHKVADIRKGECHESEEGHEQLGARGGVYYEAGFAHGLDLPVIFTCRSDMIDKVHFDTRQFNHIVWENPDDLREQLTNRIGSVLGDGPNRAH